MIRVVHPGSRIRMLTFSHPGSRGQKGTQSRIPDPDPQHWPNFKELWNFLPKKLSLSSQKYEFGNGSGIRDPGSGINPFRIPDSGVKKALDPGSESATLSITDVNVPR
jgi:hypothetical protein